MALIDRRGVDERLVWAIVVVVAWARPILGLLGVLP